MTDVRCQAPWKFGFDLRILVDALEIFFGSCVFLSLYANCIPTSFTNVNFTRFRCVFPCMDGDWKDIGRPVPGTTWLAWVQSVGW